MIKKLCVDVGEAKHDLNHPDETTYAPGHPAAIRRGAIFVKKKNSHDFFFLSRILIL